MLLKEILKMELGLDKNKFTSLFIKIIIVTVILLMTTIISIGGGHGTYVLAKSIYPITMIITLLTKNGIETIPIIIAILQVPIYSIIVIKKPKWKFYLISIHLILAIIALNLSTESFG